MVAWTWAWKQLSSGAWAGPFASGEPIVELGDSFRGARRGPGGELVVGGGARRALSPPFSTEAGGRYWLEARLGAGPGAAVEVVPAKRGRPLKRLNLAPESGRILGALVATPEDDPKAFIRVTPLGDGRLVLDHLSLRPVSPLYPRLAELWKLAGLAGALVLCWRHRQRSAAVAGALVVLSLAIYSLVDVAEAYNGGDNHWYVPSAMSLLHEGDLELSEFFPAAVGKAAGDYRLTVVDGRVYNRYPVGTTLVAAPLVALGSWLHDDAPRLTTRARRTAALAARILAALSVGLMFLVARELAGARAPAIALALVFAFATSHLSLHAGGLWSHNVSVALLLLALYLLVVRRGERAWLSAPILVLTLLARPPAALLVVGVGLYLALRRRSQVLRWSLAAAAALLPFVAWSLNTFGSILPPYYLQGGLEPGLPWRILAAQMVSPNRGLLIFTPILAFSWVGIWLSFRHRRRFAHLYRVLATLVLVHWYLISCFRYWWGGEVFGPRLFAEMLPLWMLLLIPVWDRVHEAGRGRRLAIGAAAALAVLFGAFAHFRGAAVDGPLQWSRWPSRVSYDRARVWDWNDMQIFRRTCESRRDPRPGCPGEIASRGSSGGPASRR